jgi:plasmid stabilization system protein ParE
MSVYALKPLAKADIFDIWSYVTGDNQDAADRVEQAIYDGCAFVAVLMSREFCRRQPDEVTEGSLCELQFRKIPLISLRIKRHKTISLGQGMRSNDEISQ